MRRWLHAGMDGWRNPAQRSWGLDGARPPWQKLSPISARRVLQPPDTSAFPSPARDSELEKMRSVDIRAQNPRASSETHVVWIQHRSHSCPLHHSKPSPHSIAGFGPRGVRIWDAVGQSHPRMPSCRRVPQEPRLLGVTEAGLRTSIPAGYWFCAGLRCAGHTFSL